MSGQLHVGLVINPLAGIGGSLALKGSDGEQVREIVRCSGDIERNTRSLQRTERALAVLQKHADLFRFTTWAGPMGQQSLEKLGFNTRVLGAACDGLTSAQDTQKAAAGMLAGGVDIIVFAGGDGTARDICDVVGTACPVLGIPAGVKMHSGVFAVSPEAAGELILRLARGGMVDVKAGEVRDIDEEAFRNNIVRSRFYGDMLVPGDGHYLQHTKVGGREDPELAAADIAVWVVSNMQPGHTYLVGPGSTTAAIMEELGLPNTLLGVDVVRDRELVAADADEQTLLAQVNAAASILVTVIGGQGYIFGRGNQQFSPALIRAVGVKNITVVAAKSKLSGLEGRPLLVDTNDADLDRELCGVRPVVTGYDDRVLYRVSCSL